MKKTKLKIFVYALTFLTLIFTLRLAGQESDASQIRFDRPGVLLNSQSDLRTAIKAWFNDNSDLIIVRSDRTEFPDEEKTYSYSIEIWKNPPDNSGVNPRSITLSKSVIVPIFRQDASECAFFDNVSNKLFIQNTSDSNLKQEKLISRKNGKVLQLAFVGKGEQGLAVLFDSGRIEIYNSATLDLYNYTALDKPKQPTAKIPFEIWGSETFLYIASYNTKTLFRYYLKENGDFKPVDKTATSREEFSPIPKENLILDTNKTGTAVFSASNIQHQLWSASASVPEKLQSIDFQVKSLKIISEDKIFAFNYDTSNIHDCNKNKCQIIKSDGSEDTLKSSSSIDVKDNKVVYYTGTYFRGYLYFATLSEGVAPLPSPDKTPTATRASETSISAWIAENFLLILLTLISVFLGCLAFVYYLRYRKEFIDLDEDKIEVLAEAKIVDAPPVYALPQPDVPPGLIKACMSGDCVLFAGAGVSAPSGHPTWQGFIDDLIRWAEENGFLDQSTAQAYQEENHQGDGNLVADNIYSKVQESDRLTLMFDYLHRKFQSRPSEPESSSKNSGMPEIGHEPNNYHKLFKRIKFSGILTTNFDDLIETAYFNDALTPATYRDTEKLLTALTKREFFLLKLYGDLKEQSTLLVAPVQFEEAVTNNRSFAQFMETLFHSRTLLFVGASMSSLETFLTTISLPRGFTTKHYALVHVVDNAWQAKADFLNRRYGITVIPFTTDGSFTEASEFLENLIEQIGETTGDLKDQTNEPARLQKIYLENIGPFEKLELDLNLDWNVLLGDNGVGKSTILRSVAVALCGEKAAPYAGRLIRAKSGSKTNSSSEKDSDDDELPKSGKIILTTTKNIAYITDIDFYPKTEECVVKSNTARPLEAEGWFAVGFPAIRSIGWKTEGPSAEPINKFRPVADDLIPILTGEPDPRLDKLKQWIVTLDSNRARYEEKSPGSGQKWGKLIHKLFDVINVMIAPLRIKYKEIDPKNNRIIIEVEKDGEIPLESISQGMASLIGWIGVIMQRLFEIYDGDADPLNRYALILMDEIDAHMHPEWQQNLVPRLRKVFPNAQFIISTHSPLIISELEAAQLFRFIRNENEEVAQISVTPQMVAGRTDQILTGPLFGLENTLKSKTREDLKLYTELSAVAHPTIEQKEKMQWLAAELKIDLPSPEQREEARQAYELISSSIDEKIKAMPKENKQKVVDELKAQLLEITSKNRRPE